MSNWLYDDSEHLSIAYSLSKGEGLSKDTIDIEARFLQTNIPSLTSYDQISNPLRSKPPLYLTLLAGWLKVTNANYGNWSSMGVALNYIFVGAFITIFYFFVKRHFGFEIAAYSTPIVVTAPLFLWMSVRIRPEILLYALMITTVYFAARKISYSNVALTGLFAGLCHLVHPSGYLVGVAIFIYLLFKLKFRAALILIGTWAIVLAPWMARNYIVFGDVNQGFGLPIPKSLLTALGLITPNALYSSVAVRSGDITSVASIPLDSILHGMLDQFANQFGMQFFMPFVAFSIFAFLSFHAIKRKVGRSYWMLILLFFGILIYIRAVLLVLFIPGEKNVLLYQLLIFFIAPLLVYLYFRLSSHRKEIFANEGKGEYTILAILAIISFIPYIMYAEITGREVPEVRIVVGGLYMVMPLAVIGFRKIVEFAIGCLARSSQKTMVTLIMIGILGLYSYAQLLAGIPAINALSGRFSESEVQKDLHEWMRHNVPTSAKIASDMPHAVLLRTGHEAMNFHPGYIDNIPYERWVIKKFDIDFIVLYTTINPLTVADLNGIRLQTVYKGEGGGFIYKVIEG